MTNDTLSQLRAEGVVMLATMVQELRAENERLRALLQEAIDTPWVGVDNAHTDVVASVKRRIYAALREGGE